MLPQDALGEGLFLASSCIWWLLAFLGLWPRHSNLCLCLCVAFFSLCHLLCVISSVCLLPGHLSLELGYIG